MNRPKSGTKPSYVPSKAELVDAISVTLKDTNSFPTTKELQNTLESENPSWKLEKRRVAKYLKREYKKQVAGGTAATNQDGDSIASTGSTMSVARRAAMKVKNVFHHRTSSESGARKGFSFRKKKIDKLHSVPTEIGSGPITKQSKATLLPAPVHHEEPQLLPPATEGAAEAADRAGVYEEDKEEKKENQLCSACTGCAIL